MDFSLPDLITWILVFAFSISVHESAHALSAYLLGDPTAKNMGRISLNPMKHLDPLGLLFLIVAHFGWAKPVPVNPRNFVHPRFHDALVAAAGPFSNIALATLSLLLVRVLNTVIPLFLINIFGIVFFVNVLLAAFNLIPLKPLDGEGILSLFIPNRFREGYEKFAAYGPAILFGMIGFGFAFNVNILSYILTPIITLIITFLEFLVLI